MAVSAKFPISKDPSFKLSLTALTLMFVAGLAFLVERYLRLSSQNFSFDYGFEIGRMLLNFGGMALLSPLICKIAGITIKRPRIRLITWLVGFVLFILLYILVNKLGLLLLTGELSSMGNLVGVKKLMINFFHLLVLFYLAMGYVGHRIQKRNLKKSETKTIQEKITSFQISVNGIPRQLGVEKIAHLQAFDHYIKLHVDGEFHLIRKPMKEVLQRLPERFIQIHRSHIVNTKFIKGIIKKQGKSWVVLQDQTQLPISNSYRESLKKKLSEG